MRFDILAEGASRGSSALRGFQVGTCEDQLVLGDGVDGLLGSALKFYQLLTQVGIGCNRRDGRVCDRLADGSEFFFRWLVGLWLSFPNPRFDVIRIDHIKKISGDLRKLLAASERLYLGTQLRIQPLF